MMAAAGAAAAGESNAAVDLWAPPSSLPLPADRGKPLMLPPLEAGPDTSHCLPPLPCGTQLYGAIQKDGAVELQVPALRW